MMKGTLAASLLVLCAFGAGLLVAPVLGLTTVEWTKWTAGVRDLGTVVGLIIGGAWAYSRYVEKREGEPRAKINHHLVPIDLESGKLLLRVVLEIENSGTVAVEPFDGSMLVQIPAQSPATSSDDPDKSWIQLHKLEYPFRRDCVIVEPGETERYSRDVVVDGHIRVVQLHSRVACYKEGDTPAWDDTTVHVLKPSPAVKP